MPNNEKSSPKLGKLASAILRGDKKPTVKDAQRLAGSVLTQRPNKRK